MGNKETNHEAVLIEHVFAAGIDFITGVPDSEFKKLISELESRELGNRYVRATREDNAIALAAGAYLAGKKPLVFMESSGLGNTIDVLTSLLITYEIPMVLYIAWAGFKGRDVTHHNAIGEPLEPLLQSLNVPTVEVLLDDQDPATIAKAIGKAQERAEAVQGPVAVLGIPKKLVEVTAK